MEKLTRDEKLPSFPAPEPVAISEPSCCIFLSNMFDLSQVDLEKDPAFFVDIRDEVMGKHVFNYRGV